MRRADGLHAGLVAGVLFALYAASAPHTVALEDDGLFILASYYLGIAHPPGYPLFTLVGHLFSLLPFGSVAYRVHLASALFGALSCALLWLCARQLSLGRLPAHVAAFALGVSPVFWSQSIIAEVYTLNAFFFLLLAHLGLKDRPPLPWLALIFGLSLSNHWPLMLLVAPAFAVLAWPMREEIVRRAALLGGLAALGLVPYAWLVYRSLAPLPISFYGPLETLADIWYFVSRAGYAEIDRSPAAGWIDRLKFFRFFAGQLVLQFALLGTALAAAGFAVQWRRLGPRRGAFLTVAFLMPSAVLLLLLGFDYSAVAKHVFHVYPLPAYAVAALWAGLGFAWLAERYALRPVPAAAAAGALLALVFAVGARTNVLADGEWGARYARTLLAVFPENAVVFTQGEADLAPLAYFHMIENVRPDITLFQSKGLVLGNRLFNPTATDEEARRQILREMVERQSDPVVFTLESFGGYARIDRWLYVMVDKSSRDVRKVSADVPARALEFFERDLARADHANAWVGFFQGQLRRRYGEVFAQALPRAGAPDARARRHLELLGRDYYGTLGVVEGLMRNPEGYSVGEVARLLDKARELMPADVSKDELARFFHLRAAVRAGLGDEAGALQDFETAFSAWPVTENPAVVHLEALYARAGNKDALDALRARLKRTRDSRS
ncbi:MAG TPA: DUF2723 domain-containing protein [Burkholderiales bacterium]|nr:DUF2723 domain-containing protein [Burkholderiales bacterium]